MTSDTALIFVLNRKYVRPLKVLLYSLYRQNSLRSCPIEIITDDMAVAEDPFLRAVANGIQYLPPEDREVFGSIKGDKISEKSRTTFAPKYTFLKFMVFKNKGYHRHIFIDADMLCLKPLDEDLLALPYDAKAMIEVPSSIFPIRDESRAKFSRQKAMGYVDAARAPREGLVNASINSGFMVLEGRAISDQRFESAIEIASSIAFPAEQPATTEAIRSIPDLSFLAMPLWYNCRRRVLESLGEAFFESVRDEIVLLHYTPGKPWILGDRTADFLDHLWLDYEQQSLPWVESVTAGGVRWHQLT